MTDNVIDVEFREVPKDIPEEKAEVPADHPGFDKREERVFELLKPIREQILKCETRGEVLLMAGQLLQHAKDIYLCELGVETTKAIFNNLDFEMPVDETENDSN